MADPIAWGAQPLIITRKQQLDAVERVGDWLTAHPEWDNSGDGLTRDDLIVLMRGTTGYHQDGGPEVVRRA